MKALICSSNSKNQRPGFLFQEISNEEPQTRNPAPVYHGHKTRRCEDRPPRRVREKSKGQEQLDCGVANVFVLGWDPRIEGIDWIRLVVKERGIQHHTCGVHRNNIRFWQPHWIDDEIEMKVERRKNNGTRTRVHVIPSLSNCLLELRSIPRFPSKLKSTLQLHHLIHLNPSTWERDNNVAIAQTSDQEFIQE